MRRSRWVLPIQVHLNSSDKESVPYSMSKPVSERNEYSPLSR